MTEQIARLQEPATRAVVTMTESACMQILPNSVAGQNEVLSDGVKCLLKALCKQFAAKVPVLLEKRKQKQLRTDLGELPDFLPETEDVRKQDWQIRGIPLDLQDRRVEITAPTERKTVINALNANAKVFMADFADSLSPTWDQLIQGQLNLKDTVNGDINYTDPDTGKFCGLKDNPAVLICRVRGLHMLEKHVQYSNKAIPASLFDFCVYFYNNYRKLLSKNSAPYFYIPKIESHLEARWWAEVFAFVEERFCLQPGTIKCTCLIETLPAVFEMEEILFELRANIVALNSGNLSSVMSDAEAVETQAGKSVSRLNTDSSSLDAYERLLIKTCHKRGALALAGTSTDDLTQMTAVKNAECLSINPVMELKARSGFDGINVNYAQLVDTAMSVFNRYIGEGNTNQLHITRDVDAPIRAQELLAVV
ncbi:hypothetical protein TUM4438_39790 [Shewanella sairae]|uniref:malate synthase n=1 Tax=Shewanella sairae TaxID=190310 RepID=A0ABQ4PQH6_9GAMM|nr:hypothetical protein TUM4438_39790 [Shewanella sairae]